MKGLKVEVSEDLPPRAWLMASCNIYELIERYMKPKETMKDFTQRMLDEKKIVLAGDWTK